MRRRTVVTLCTGSSGNHVLAADLGRRDAFEVRLVTSRPASWRARIECEEIHVASDALPLLWPTRSERYAGTLDAIHAWEDAARACEGADLVVLTCPVHCHRDVLERVIPALRRPSILGTLYAQGGFDWIYRDVCRRLGVPPQRHTLFGLKRFPFLCATLEYGRAARLMGRFPKVVVAVEGGDPPQRARARALLGALLDKPVVEVPGFLNCTLNLSNQILHPALAAPLLHGYVPGRTTFAQPLAFYGSCRAAGAANMCALANEFRALGQALEALTGTEIQRTMGADPGVRFYLVLRQLFGRYLEGDRRYEWLRDNLVALSLRHNRRLEQARFPLIPAPGGEGLVPDFGSRFWRDDIPHGLCVVYGLGLLLGVPMPRTRALALEHQAYMGKQYLCDDPGAPAFGRDLGETNAPQRYGVHDREALRAFLQHGSA